MLLPLLSELCVGDTCPPVLAFSGVVTVEARSQGNFKRANADSFLLLFLSLIFPSSPSSFSSSLSSSSFHFFFHLGLL